MAMIRKVYKLQVEVKFFGGIENFIPGTQFNRTIQIDIPQEYTVRMLLKKINVPDEIAIFFLVNDVYKDFDVILFNGDKISIFPAVAGG